MDFDGDRYTWPLYFYMITACTYPLMSASAHAFSALSPAAQKIGYFLDYTALALYSFGSAILYRAYVIPDRLMASVFAQVPFPSLADDARRCGPTTATTPTCAGVPVRGRGQQRRVHDGVVLVAFRGRRRLAEGAAPRLLRRALLLGHGAAAAAAGALLAPPGLAGERPIHVLRWFSFSFWFAFGLGPTRFLDRSNRSGAEIALVIKAFIVKEYRMPKSRAFTVLVLIYRRVFTGFERLSLAYLEVGDGSPSPVPGLLFFSPIPANRFCLALKMGPAGLDQLQSG